MSTKELALATFFVLAGLVMVSSAGPFVWGGMMLAGAFSLIMATGVVIVAALIVKGEA